LVFKNIGVKGLAIGEVADFGAQNCENSTKFDARQNVQLSTTPAIEPNTVRGGFIVKV